MKDLFITLMRDIFDNTGSRAKFDWRDSIYEDTQYLSIDGRGKLGESIVASVLRSNGCQVIEDDGATAPERGYDLIVDGIKIEVKLATITVGSGMFQHENLHPQRDFDGILFIDIAPNEVFLTAVKKQDVFWTSSSIKQPIESKTHLKRPRAICTAGRMGITNVILR